MTDKLQNSGSRK